ncbi:hypothetical protein PAHAL_4G101900 [Panicum hallii]|jgi:hypothetical protein|uniref:Uncharacterized protein n=1 Tax=Panicum hallii TaxID=206008 RepID=A0A2T8JCG1_9POAL|nr:uncharacterized protein LOC112888637 isoform X2 [Panicum hallii]PAN23565.1 hypothetical protein PAHAL_4G101900 [Panicum hallii]PVH47614.1 hypothetical protein PAHAL_4G101900 [Panicum hallii]
MTDERHSMAEEGRAAAVGTNEAGLPAPLRTEKKAGAAPPPAPLPPRPTEKAAQAEKGVNAPREPCRTARAQENMEFGAGIAAFGASMMVAWYFLSPDGRGSHNLRYIIPMLLSFACFTSGLCLMLLSMNILELPESVVADVQDMASKCLSWLCSILPVVTLLSPLVLSGYKIYRYVGLTLLVIVTAPIALLRWYIGRKAEGGGIQAALSEHREQLEDAFKFISAISNSASAGLVALVVNYNVTGGSGCNKGAILAVIFFMFTTAVWGLLSMEIRAKVLEIKSTRLQGFIIQALWLAIIFMLLSLACAVFTEVFAIVEFWIFAAFTPWVFASAIYLFLENCIHQSVPRDKTANVSLELEVQLNLKAERGIKVTMWSFMAIIGIFGGFLHGHDKIESLKACIVLFTSAFMSGFALTLVTIRPNLTSTSLAAATKALDWTAVATFVAAIFAIIVAMILEVL